jgi:hypothetical protein
VLLSSHVLNGKTVTSKRFVEYFSGTFWNLNKFTEITRDAEEEKLNTWSHSSEVERRLTKDSDNVHKSSPPS